MPESVNHPQHYGGDTLYETIKVLKAWLSPEEFRGFCIGNAIKYLSRAGKKADDQLQDWRKARWYVDYIIADIEAQQDANIAALFRSPEERAANLAAAVKRAGAAIRTHAQAFMAAGNDYKLGRRSVRKASRKKRTRKKGNNSRK